MSFDLTDVDLLAEERESSLNFMYHKLANSLEGVKFKFHIS